MKAVFGEISKETAAEWGFTTINVEDDDSDEIRHFEHFVEFGSKGHYDEFIIGDAIGRSVPICIGDLNYLVEILLDLQNVVKVTNIAEQYLNDIDDEDNVEIY